MASGGLGETLGKGLAGAVEFAPHAVGGLFGDEGDLVVREMLVGGEQQDETLIGQELIERGANAFAELLGFEHADRAGLGRGRAAIQDLVGVGDHRALMPGGTMVAAVVERDLVEPGADGGLAAKGIERAKCLKENIVRHILGERWLTEEAQGEVVNGGGVGVVEELKRRVQPVCGRRLDRLRGGGLGISTEKRHH